MYTIFNKKHKRAIALTTAAAVLLIFFGTRIFVVGQQAAYQTYYGIKHRNLPKSGSRIDTVSFFSSALQATSTYAVYVPEGYDEHKDRRYPVLYLLHGYPGNFRDWPANGDAAMVFNQLIVARDARPFLAVFPDGNGPKIADSQYVNASTAQQRMEDFIVTDIRTDAEHRYRTLSDPSGRAIGGNSSGGYGAVNLGLRHPEIYGSILAYGAYFDNWRGQLNAVFGNNQSAKDAQSPARYFGQLTLPQNLCVFQAVGKYDWPSLVKENREFDQQLAATSVIHTLVLTGGTHNWNTWNKQLPAGIRYWEHCMSKSTTPRTPKS